MKTHYVGLDGLRGIAALSVLYLHQLGLFGGGGRLPAALAVDFFFMLSGFVLAHAYGEKLKRDLSWSQYMTARIIRLYPMLLLGIVLGGLLHFVRPMPHENAATFVATLFVLPVGLLWAQSAFLFNGIIWSLFFELVASGVYGTRLWKPVYFFAFAVSLLALGIWAGSITYLGRYGLIGFLGGFPRVAVSFAIGAALYKVASRQNQRPSVQIPSTSKRFSRIPFAVPALGLCALLLMPIRPQWPYDLACIFVAFPLVICVGARSSGGLVCEMLGRLSYPIYLIHWPLTQVIGFIVKSQMTDSPPFVIAATMLSSILFAWAALVFYDEPVRHYLRSRYGGNVPASSAMREGARRRFANFRRLTAS